MKNGGSAGGYLALSTGFSTANIQMGDLSILNQPSPYDIVIKDSIVSYGDYDSRMQLWRFLARKV